MGNVRFGLDHKLAQYVSNQGIDLAFETGTYLGDSTDLLAQSFREVHTIEVRPELVEQAVIRFANYSNIAIHHGNSSDVLANLLNQSRRPAFFWLDAHWFPKQSSAIFVEQCPLLGELRAIDQYAHRDTSVIAIDDLTLFSERQLDLRYVEEQWPSLDQIHSIVDSWPHRRITHDDVIILLPSTFGTELLK